MASAIRMVDKIRQIVQLKLMMRRWRDLSLGHHRRPALPCPDTPRRAPPGFCPVYVGPARRRFVIPTRYLNLPVFAALLGKAEEEFGYQGPGALALPCDPDAFAALLRALDKGVEGRLLGLDNMDDLLNVHSCKDESVAGGNSAYQAFTPLLTRARV